MPYFHSKAHYIFCIIADDIRPCAPAPDVTNTRVERTGTNPGDVTVYSCLAGYYFTEGGIVRTIICSVYGEWSADVQKCVGRILYASCILTKVAVFQKNILHYVNPS